MNRTAVQRPKLLVTGASGLLGGALCRLAADQWDVYGLYHDHPVQMAGIRVFQADLTRRGDVDGLLHRLEPDAVIHAAAIADVGRCQCHPDQTTEINVNVPARLAAWCSRHDVPFGFTSTDMVFDGSRAPYDEQCPVNPLNHYARQKVRAEVEVLTHYSKAVVFRLPLMIGVSPLLPLENTRHFCRQMLAAIHLGRMLNLFIDEYRTPVDIDSAATGILIMLGRVHGLVHLGGRMRISRYDLGVMMAAAMGRAPDMIQAVRIAEIPGGAERAGDVSLNSDRAIALGYMPTPLMAAVQSVVNQYLVISNI